MYTITYHREARKDFQKLKSANLSHKTQELLNIIAIDLYQSPPPYEELFGNLRGFISRRINIKHRLVYEVNEVESMVKIHRMWSHYEGLYQFR